MNRLVNVVIVLVVIGCLGGALYFSTRGHQPRVLDYEKPADPPAAPPVPPAIVTAPPTVLPAPRPPVRLDEGFGSLIQPIARWNDSQSRTIKVYSILGHHFLFVSEDGYLKTVTEFTAETHVSVTPPTPPASGETGGIAPQQSSPAPPPATPPKKADGGDGGNWPSSSTLPKTEASP